MTSHSIIIHLVYWIALSFNIFALYHLADPQISRSTRQESISFWYTVTGIIANASLISYFYFFV